jgi:hypothetical protein
MNADMSFDEQPADPHFQAWWRRRRQEILDEGARAGVLKPKPRSSRDTVKRLLADLDTN